MTLFPSYFMYDERIRSTNPTTQFRDVSNRIRENKVAIWRSGAVS